MNAVEARQFTEIALKDLKPNPRLKRTLEAIKERALKGYSHYRKMVPEMQQDIDFSEALRAYGYTVKFSSFATEESKIGTDLVATYTISW